MANLRQRSNLEESEGAVHRSAIEGLVLVSPIVTAFWGAIGFLVVAALGGLGTALPILGAATASTIGMARLTRHARQRARHRVHEAARGGGLRAEPNREVHE